MVYCGMAMEEDPGYKATARMLTESALSLALNDLNVPAGFHTPASALGETLHSRLLETGTKFGFYKPENEKLVF
jgi:short subunit dehydrogenase-like uncharacterized protein